MTERAFYEFGPFRVNPRQHLLLRDGEVVPLPPKPLTCSSCWLKTAETSSAKKIEKQVWPDSFVEEANLSHHVSRCARR